jgi:hypothetical protein
MVWLHHGDVVELVDTLALGASAARREGSSPFVPTNFMKEQHPLHEFMGGEYGDFLLPRDSAVAETAILLSKVLSLDRLQQIFKDKDEGVIMSQMARFKAFFMPDDLTDKQWMNLLGAQGSDLRHGDYTRATGEILLADEPDKGLPAEVAGLEKFLIGVTNLTHDWGEVAVGDIPFGAEKAERPIERTMRSALAWEVLRDACDEQEMFGDSTNQAIDFIVEWSDKLAFQEFDIDGITKPKMTVDEYYLHFYRANKYLGHCSAALRMGRVLEEKVPIVTGSVAGEDHIKLLNALVSCNDLGVLLQYAKKFPGVYRYIQAYKGEIDAAIENASDMFYYTGIPRDNQELPLTLDELKSQWQEFCQASSSA